MDKYSVRNNHAKKGIVLSNDFRNEIYAKWSVLNGWKILS